MPRYKMSFKKCYEPFPGDSHYRDERRTFEAASDEEATKKAEEIAGKELNMDNVSISTSSRNTERSGASLRPRSPRPSQSSLGFPQRASEELHRKVAAKYGEDKSA